MNKWTFKSQISGGGPLQNSTQVFDTQPACLKYVIEWIKICADNDYFPQVALVKLDRDGKANHHE